MDSPIAPKPARPDTNAKKSDAMSGWVALLIVAGLWTVGALLARWVLKLGWGMSIVVSPAVIVGLYVALWISARGGSNGYSTYTSLVGRDSPKKK